MTLLTRIARYIVREEIRHFQRWVERLDGELAESRARGTMLEGQLEQSRVYSGTLEAGLRDSEARRHELELQISQAAHSYSWEGEDRLALKLFHDVFGIEKGFFVDVGAAHPFNFSNTMLLYQAGWRGLNIDAAPGTAALFNAHRPEDINVEAGVAAEAGIGKFHVMSDPLLNGFLSEETLNEHVARGARLIATHQIECLPLGEIIDRHAPGRAIDLLTIDAEGLDLEILRSLDFGKHRPKLIISEIPEPHGPGSQGANDAGRSEIARFLESRGYEFYSRLHFSSFFIDRACLPGIKE